MIHCTLTLFVQLEYPYLGNDTVEMGQLLTAEETGRREPGKELGRK
jgi:hypothetical protein